MTDNLIFYINKLSYIIVSEELDNDKSQHPKRKSDRYFNICVKKVRQRGCDVLLNRNSGVHIEDPCLTDYGGNWSPLTLITDYGRELQAQGAGKYNELLVNCISTLEEKPYDCVEDLLKLLLLLRKPINRGSSGNFQNDASSDFLLNGMDSLSFLSEEFSSEGLSKSASYKKALHYEESWTKHFDSKFQLLGEYSRKNLSCDKVSLKSIFSSKDLTVSAQSRTNSFGFTDFYTRNYKSEKSLFDINSDVYLNENPLLDSFVDRPISHKLPSLKPVAKFSCKSGFLEKSSTDLKTPSFPEDKLEDDSSLFDSQSRKASVIELKRNSNCSHSFSILYQKSVKSQGSWNIESKESLKEKGKTVTPYSNSKEIILGLWEQEQSVIKEFRPELAGMLPSLRMITQAEFIEDVKYLFTGINSDTFKFDTDRNGFSMVYGTCLEDVTPESLYYFSKDFLDIGDCYVKLISCVYETGKNNFDTCTTISQAFWKSIFDYLELHYSLVLEIPAAINLMALKSCTRELHEIITTVASICMVDTARERLPQGGELLTYLLQFVEGISKQCVVNIVFGILQNCCNVYYMCILQSWMFRGHLDSQSNEFFVDYRREKGKTKSRSYYNSFFLVDEKVPSFLQGYEDNFYNCGKSVHFLKLFNAEDTFCQVLEKGYYPSMRLCFADEQLDKLESEFKTYEERMLKLCGERISIKNIMDEEKEKEKKFQEYVKNFKAAQEKKKQEERMKQIEKMKVQKEKKNKLLNEQRHSIDAEKKRRKREEKEKELKLEAEIKKSNESRENLLNEEKTLLKKRYSDLMDNLEKEIVVSEARKESLRRIIEAEASDLTNEVEIDHEGNINNQLDVNSNSSGSTCEKTVKVTNPSLESDSSFWNFSVDENSNPCSEDMLQINLALIEEEEKIREEEEDVRKSSSYRTVAAEEAAKNKCKILMSEFGLPVRNEPPQNKPEPKPIESMTDLQRNRQRVLQSEYGILLKKTQTHVSLTSVPRHLNMVKENSLEKDLKQVVVEELPMSSFSTVQLERKEECLDLNCTPEQTQPAPCPSSESNLTLSNDFSVENVSNSSEEGEQVKTPGSSSALLSEKYQDALIRDTEIFKKNSRQDIFCSLKEEVIDNLPCTDFLKFQRYLRKSALIPLKVQEKLASDALLKHLLQVENLLSHLKSLRGYFFLNDGEFGRSFTQQIFRSLSKCTEPCQFFERSNLSNIVNEAQNYTIHNSDPNSQNLSFRIVKMPPFLNHSSHDVLAPFELSYKVDWPLNFILTEKALNKYKLVFRFLLKLKRINWTLNENFLYLNSYSKCSRLKGKVLVGSSHYHKIQIFRHAMTQVMITLDDYIFSNGIQFPWIYFLKDLETTENIDHLYEKHVRYIKDVLTRCFLSKNSEELLDCINDLIELALKFHYTCKSSLMEFVNGKYEHPKFSVLKATFNEFCSVIKTFLNTLKEKLSSNEVARSHYVLIEKFDLKLT